MPSSPPVPFSGRLVIVGFGSIGQGVLPLIMRHIEMPMEHITIIAADDHGWKVAAAYGLKVRVAALTPANLATVLGPLLGPGDFLLNLSVNVSSVALLRLCREAGALYLDTCVEPWAGGYADPSLTTLQRSNYALRESALALARPGAGDPTALIAHGANPGLVSLFTKQALLNIARDTGLDVAVPSTRRGWAALSSALGVKVIHIAERDTQVADRAKQHGEFVNTWSVPGFVGEASQPAELGWGTHERRFPADGLRHDFGCGAAICLDRRGGSTRVRSWTPREGPFNGFLITHNEAISLADYYTVSQGSAVVYRPTVHYAYHPCDDAVQSLEELTGRSWDVQPHGRLLMHEITEGGDELGVLLMGHALGSYWFGSCLSIETARRLAPHNNATSLQVAASVLGGMAWVIENPARGVVEADNLDHARILAMAAPYLGTLAGAYSDWTPLRDSGAAFSNIDQSCPWQFDHFRLA